MSPESRRSARAQREAEMPDVDAADAKAPRWRRALGISLLSLLILVIVAIAWLGFRVFTVAGDLQEAQSLISNADDGMSFDERVDAIGENAAAAASGSSDPVWRAAELIPIAGDNLRAVRVSAASLDVIINDLAVPAVDAMNADTEDPKFASLLPVLEEVSPEVTRLAAEVDEASAHPLVPPVRSAVDTLNEIMSVAAPAIESAPAMLGADGIVNYLLVFQNNAESLPLGGSAASQTLISADGGEISIAAQASSADFEEGVPVNVAVDQSALDLYGIYLIDHVNTTTSRPDFPTAADLLTAFWKRDIGDDEITAVVSVDPIALERVLKATGPITVAGIELTEKNAVDMLLSEAYSRWDATTPAGAKASDAFFALTAAQVFGKVASGDFDLKDMAWAINESVKSGDLMMWSEDERITPLLQGKITGALPKSNDAETAVGVFYRDTSASKIDYYMKAVVDVVGTCSAGAQSLTTSSTLHLDLTQEEADQLPEYVASRHWGSSQFRTEVFVYGPVGATIDGVSVDGAQVTPISTDVVDLGRPVAKFETVLTPGATATVTATFTASGGSGPLSVRTTPMVNPTDVSVTSGCD